MTSVGSGSLIIIALMAPVPRPAAPASWSAPTWCRPSRWWCRAAIAHIFFGDFRIELTAALLIGSVPGVWIGAQLSSRAPGGLVRRVLAFVLLASGSSCSDVSTVNTGWILLAVALVAPPLWMVVRRRHGLPMLLSRSDRTVEPPATEPAGKSSGT